jgi:hypothetical protein
MSDTLPTLSQIEIVGRALMEHTDSPVPRWRIVKDILRLPAEDPTAIETWRSLVSCPWLHELAGAQLPDGSWGRFHSRDSALKQRYPTTELAIRRALSLGLDAADPILKNTMTYIRAVLDGKVAWTDLPEKHEGWPVNIRFITAATLLLLDPEDDRAAAPARTWTEVASATFRTGSYSPEAERDAHLRLNGIHTKGKYLKLAGLYPLLLLSSKFSGLPEREEKALLDWVWNKPDGIYYVYGGKLSELPAPRSPHFIDWLAAIELLSRFKYGRELCAPVVARLWGQRGADGYWDFGSPAKNGYTLPLSESWQRPIDRKVDCSVLALSLIHRCLPE